MNFYFHIEMINVFRLELSSHVFEQYCKKKLILNTRGIKGLENGKCDMEISIFADLVARNIEALAYA